MGKRKKKIRLDDVRNGWDVCPQKLLCENLKEQSGNLPATWAKILDYGTAELPFLFSAGNLEDAEDLEHDVASFKFEQWANMIVRVEQEKVVRGTIKWITEIRDNAVISRKAKERWEKFLRPFLDKSISALQKAALRERKKKFSWDLFPKLSAKTGKKFLDLWAVRFKERLRNLLQMKGREVKAVDDSFFEKWARQILRNYSTEEIEEILEKLRHFRKEAAVTPEMAQVWNEVVLPFIEKSERALEEALAKKRKKAEENEEVKTAQ